MHLSVHMAMHTYKMIDKTPAYSRNNTLLFLGLCLAHGVHIIYRTVCFSITIVVEPGKPAWRKIKEIFGKEFLLVDGTLNRDKLGHVIFSDPDKRRLLNSITHPEIYKAMIWRVLGYCLSGNMVWKVLGHRIPGIMVWNMLGFRLSCM